MLIHSNEVIVAIGIWTKKLPPATKYHMIIMQAMEVDNLPIGVVGWPLIVVWAGVSEPHTNVFNCDFSYIILHYILFLYIICRTSFSMFLTTVI